MELYDKNKFNTNNKIFAIGDCNNILPKTAQNAEQQGKYLAKCMNNNFENTEHYKFNNLGYMIRLRDKTYIETPYYSGFTSEIVTNIVASII